MLRRLSQRRWHTLQLYELQGVRGVHGAYKGSESVSEPQVQARDVDVSKTKRDNRLRYLVVQQQPGSALDLLEKSFYRTPVISPSETGAKTRYLKLPPPQVCSKVLSQAAAQPKLVLRAAELADALVLQGTDLEPQTLQSLVTALTKKGKGSLALSPLDHWLHLNSERLEAEEGDGGARAEALQMLTGLIDCAARSEDVALVKQVLGRMSKFGLMPSLSSVTSLLQCFMRLGHTQVAHGILEWMRRGGLQPNVYHYTTLMSLPRNVGTSGAEKLLQQARDTYQKMMEDGVRPNMHFFTAYIRLCGRARDLASALEAWHDMELQGIKPDLILYSVIIDACAKCQDADTAVQLFESMRSQGVRPDVVTYSSLLAALQGPPPQLATARQVWGEMQRSGVEPNSFAVTAFLDILLTKGEIDEALELLTAAAQQQLGGESSRSRQGHGREGRSGPPQHGDMAQMLRLYEHFMFAMARRGEWGVVEHLALHLRSRGLRHSSGTAAALLTCQALKNGMQNGRWLLHPDNPHPHQQPQPTAQHAQQHAAGGRGSQVLLSAPDHLVDRCLLGRGSTAEYAEGLMSGAQEQGPLSGDGLSLLLGGLAVQGLQEKAFQLHDWAKLEGLRPDGWTLPLLMFAALNAPRAQQLDLLVRALGEGRHHGSKADAARRGQGRQQHCMPDDSLWCQRTRSAILSVLRQSNKAREILGDTQGSQQSDDEKDAVLYQILSSLGEK